MIYDFGPGVSGLVSHLREFAGEGAGVIPAKPALDLIGGRECSGFATLWIPLLRGMTNMRAFFNRAIAQCKPRSFNFALSKERGEASAQTGDGMGVSQFRYSLRHFPFSVLKAALRAYENRPV
jgi:hypothetical protein